jgi:glycosyltransferase involved in cell wall biosynthesis
MNGSRQPRVLHVAETIQGGVGGYLNEILEPQIDALGPENVRVLIPENQQHFLELQDRGVIATFEREGRDVASLLRFTRTLLAEYRAFRPDLIHCHSTFAGVIVRLRLLPVVPRPRIVYCAHGWSFLMEIPEWKRRIYALIERALCPLTQVVINISQHEQDQAIRYGIPKGKCIVVRNGVSLAPGDAAGDAVAFDPEKINLLFVGRFDRQKGLDLLLRVMARIESRPIHLYVIGASVIDASEFRPPANVTMLGWLPRSSLDRYYAAADAVVMPSRWEGFGLVAVEAMRNGTAVIASNRGALPEVVAHGKTGLLFELEEDRLTALEALLSTVTKADLGRLGAAGRDHFAAHFTAEIMNRKLLDIYRRTTTRFQPNAAVSAPG